MKIGNKKGFTLIELMIVIAIIGILAITIVPQLTGAQARARDTGRIANIATTRAVLETYFSDEGAFPNSDNGKCLSQADGTLKNKDLSKLFKNEKAPLDPQSKNKSLPCDQANGVLGYTPLTKDSTEGAGYIITTNVETTKRANTNYELIKSKLDPKQDNYVDLKKNVGAFTGGTEPTTGGAINSIYAELY